MGWRAAPGALLVALALLDIVRAQDASPRPLRPEELRAGVISKLPAYVEWPDDKLGAETNALRLGVLTPAGRPDTVVALLTELLKDSRVNGRPIEVAAFAQPREAGGFHLVFVPDEVNAQWWDAVAAPDLRGLVTVGESGDFLRRGGVFRLLPERRRLQVNVRHAEQAGVKLNPRLLRICDVVR